MAKKNKAPVALKSFDDLDAAGIGAGYTAQFSVDEPAKLEEPKSRGLMAVTNDTVIEAANAAAGSVSAVGNFIKPGNAVSGWIDKNIIEAGEAKQSDVTKASKKKFRDGVEEADGVMGELGAVGDYLADSPLLAAAQAAGSFVGPGAAVKGAGMAGRAAGLGAKGVERAGRAGGVAAGAAMAGGDAAGTAFDLATKAGATEEEATAAARGASVIPALVGGVAGAFGAERLLAGAKGFAGGAVARAAKTGLSEAAQEAIEEGVTQYEGQRAAMPFDSSIDPSKGVAAAAGMGAALGGMTGAGTSLFTGGRGAEVAGNPLDEALARDAVASPQQPAEMLALPAPTISVDGTGVARTAGDRNEAMQRTADGAFADITEVPEQVPTPAPEMLALPAPVINVDGAGNALTAIDRNLLAQQQLEARAARQQRLASGDILDVTPVPHAPGFEAPTPPPAPVVEERGVLSRAANIAAAASPPAMAPLAAAVENQNREQPAQAQHSPDAETGEISPGERVGQIQERLDFLAQMGRTQGWSPEAVAQRDTLQQELDLLSPAQHIEDLQAQAADAEARAADWASREYWPNPTELPLHAAQGGPADIQEANEQRRLKKIQQAKQEAAAAKAKVKELEDVGNLEARLAAQRDRAGRSDTAGMQGAFKASPTPAQSGTEILNRQGKPFTVKVAALKAAEKAGPGWEPVKVDGGYVVRQTEQEPAHAVTISAGEERAREIAREGNAQRQSTAQDEQEQSAQWDGMPLEEQRAILAAVPKLATVLRKNLEGKAWAKMSEGNRAKIADAMLARNQAVQTTEESQPAEAPLSSTDHQGEDLGNGWAAFTPESGTKAVPRAEMPQIKAEHRGAMVNFMNARGITHQEEAVPAAGLKPTQAEFSREKVEKAKGYEGGDRSILVSGDGHVLDGHHQWLAAMEQGKDVKTIRLAAPIDQLLEVAREFPSSTTSAGATPAQPGAGKSKPPEKAKKAAAMAKARADYFAPGNIVKSPSGHDRVVAYTQSDKDGRWSVTVQPVRSNGGKWVDAPFGGQRTHANPPSAQEIKAGPVKRHSAEGGKVTSNSGSFDPTSPDIRFSFAGSEARTADAMALETARKRIAAGEDADAIRRETGWHRGPDEKWRFEIDDSQARLLYDSSNPEVYADVWHEAGLREGGVPLSRALEHPRLFAAYPALGALRVKVNEGMKEDGAYDSEHRTIYVKDPYDYKAGPEELLSVLLHEIQHGIQRIEGFATGGSPSQFKDRAQERQALKDAAILRRMIDTRGGDLESAYALYEKRLGRAVSRPVLELANSGDSADALSKRAEAISPLSPQDQYERLAGEVEARNTQLRQWLTEAQRRTTPPGSTADVSEADVVVTFNGQEMKKAPAPANSRLDFDVAGFLKTMEQGQSSKQAKAEAVGLVQSTVDAISAGWANGPEVLVVHDMADPAIPVAARRADQAQRSGGAEGDPEGFYHRGKVYLLASQLPTQQDAARVLMHEALGHHGLRGVFGTSLDGVLQQIVAVRRGDVRAKAAEYGLDYDSPAQRLQAAEEVLAEWAQNRPEMGFVRRAVAAIRAWLRQHVPGMKRLTVSDDEIIRSYILPARGWVERGAGAGVAKGIAFSRASATSMPDAIIGSTLGSASSHPDYAAAKGGDIEAAVRLAKDLVTPELLAKVKAVIGDSKPLVVPVAAEEAAGRNKIPRASAEVLALRLGLDTAFDIVQANRARRTGMDGLDRLFAPVDFEGAVEPGPYLLLDDTLTQGGTFAALASHIREGGGTVAGIIALTGKQYSAKIQPSAETLASLRQKHGDLENEFRAATGYGFDSLTESEARYLARYEPADRLRDRISEEGRRGRARQDQGDSGPGAVSDGPLFSRSRLADIKDSALSQLDNILSHPGKVSMWDKTVGTMRHLAERNPYFKPVYESAQRTIDDVSMLANAAADVAPRLLPRVDSWRDLAKKAVSAADNKAVGTPLFEGTLLWTRDAHGKPARVDDLKAKYADFTVHDKAEMLLNMGRIQPGVLGMWRAMSIARFENLINERFDSKVLKPGIVWSAKELKSQFGMSDEQVGLYQEARAGIDRSIDMTARADMLRAMGDEYAGLRDMVLDQPTLEDAFEVMHRALQEDVRANADQAQQQRLMDLNSLLVTRNEKAKELMAEGYAPLSRFGRYTVDVVDQAGERQYFGLFETMREANQMARRMRQEFKGATVTQGTMSQSAFKLFAGITPESLEMFGGMLGLDTKGTDPKDQAFQAYLQLAKNNHSALKRLIHRKGISGYSDDVGRVMASFIYSNSRLASQGLNAGTIEKAINEIPKDQGELKDLAQGLRSYIQDPQDESNAVRGMLFAQYLGGSVASAFVNMTQPFQVTLPWLSQYGGIKKASAQLARALKDMGSKGFQYEHDLAKALQAAEDDGVVSPQEIHQLMAQARGAGALRAGDGTKAGNARATAVNAWERTKVAWGQPFALAEQFNRRSTFIASYRLAKEQGMASPADFARKSVLETQFVYSKANKPQWARGSIGGTLFTFKTYSVSYLELMQRMWSQGEQGSPERAAGRRAVGWSIAMLMLMSGAGGLPFVEDVEDLVDAAGQMMGYSMSSKQWRKQLVQDAVGKELADFFDQGLSGLPGAPIDVSGRLGMGNLIPGTGLFLEKRDHTRDLVEVMGPAGDLVQRAFSAARKGVSGDIAGAALEVSPTAVRNAAKGVDMAARGVYRDAKGRKVIDVTLAEAVAKGIGFQPKTVAEVQEATATEQNLIGQNRAAKERLTADMAQAVYDRDAEKQGEIRERMRAWNRRNPESPLTIDMLAVRRRVIKMRQSKADRVASAAPKAIRASVRQSLAEATAP